MNTNMTGLRCFSKILRPCALDESSLSIGRVKTDKVYLLGNIVEHNISSDPSLSRITVK